MNLPALFEEIVTLVGPPPPLSRSPRYAPSLKGVVIVGASIVVIYTRVVDFV